MTKNVSFHPLYSYLMILFLPLINQGNPIIHKDAYVLGLRTIDSGDFSLSAKSWLGLPLSIGRSNLGGLVLFDSEVSNRFSGI